MRLIKRTLVTIITLTATTSLVWGQQHAALPSAANKSIVGTWQVLRHGVDCDTGMQLGPDFQALMTFNRGGTLNAYAVSPGSTSFDSPELGNWSRVPGTQTFAFRDVGYGYDENGAFVGRGEITATVTLAADGNSFTQQSAIDIYDADGNLLFSFCGAATGTRFQ